MTRLILTAAAAALLSTSSAFAATLGYVETFDTNASGWLNGSSGAPLHIATGGVGNSGYISFTSTFTSGATGSFGAPPLQILFRGNNAANASGDAFVGNWIADGVERLSVAVRHDYSTSLVLYSRFDAGSGRAASGAADPAYTIAPNTWTTIEIPIINANPPFLSYGAAGTGQTGFNNVFQNMQNVVLGLYVPASTTFTDLKFDIDNVAIVPEPAMVTLGLPALALLARRRRA